MTDSDYIKADDVFVDTNEGRFVLIVWPNDGGRLEIDIHSHAIEFHDEVRREIGPWATEAREAQQAVARGVSLPEYVNPRAHAELLANVEALEAYATDDPKHPAWHSTHADLWDSREGK